MLTFYLLSLAVLGCRLYEVSGLECFHCNNVKDPRLCTAVSKCGHHETHYCAIEKVEEHGHISFHLGCKADHDCAGAITIGKRNGHGRAVLCRACCTGDRCNNQDSKCFRAPTSTTVTVDHQAPAPTPTLELASTDHQGCVDNEEDGLKCSDWDHYNFCNDVDGIGYAIAITKCRRHCGFCSNSSQALTSTLEPTTVTADHQGCVDNEEDGLKCSDWDQYNFCNDVDGVGFAIAITKCRRHCGFCSSSFQTSTQDPPLPDVSGTDVPCVDHEDASFSCAVWATQGLCLVSSGAGHLLALQRCRKYCGFCT